MNSGGLAHGIRGVKASCCTLSALPHPMRAGFSWFYINDNFQQQIQQDMAVSKNDSTAATFECLPFDLHVVIIRKLNLVDALSYAELNPICHDAVYYVFSHQLQLDFSSTLNKDGVIIYL